MVVRGSDPPDRQAVADHRPTLMPSVGLAHSSRGLVRTSSTIGSECLAQLMQIFCPSRRDDRLRPWRRSGCGACRRRSSARLRRRPATAARRWRGGEYVQPSERRSRGAAPVPILSSARGWPATAPRTTHLLQDCRGRAPTKPLSRHILRGSRLTASLLRPACWTRKGRIRRRSAYGSGDSLAQWAH